MNVDPTLRLSHAFPRLSHKRGQTGEMPGNGAEFCRMPHVVGQTADGGGLGLERLLPHLEGLDDVLNLHVLEVAEVDAALVALSDLGHVVLEPA